MTDSVRAIPSGKITKTEAAWRPSLRVARCCVTRLHDTARPKMSERKCAMSVNLFACGCREPRFALHARWALDAQWDWNTGWSSLAKRAAAAAAAIQHEDRGGLARRIEGHCTPRKAQLADVFPMALAKTVGRDCAINGAALPFRPGGT